MMGNCWMKSIVRLIQTVDPKHHTHTYGETGVFPFHSRPGSHREPGEGGLRRQSQVISTSSVTAG